jgi:hypothetical protein
MRISLAAWLSAFSSAALLAAGCGAGSTTDSGPPPQPGCPALSEDLTLPIPDPPDGAAECAPGDCNYQTQEGCADDESCRPQFNATDPDVSPGCEPAGSAVAGEQCQTQADCARGFYCAGKVCRRMCCGQDWSACDDGESCIRSLDVKAGGQIISAGVDLCFPVDTCDVFDPSACASEAGRECKIVDPNGKVACAPQSDADEGDPCAPPTVCKQGLNCVGGYCLKLCRFEQCGEPACGPEQGTCVHFLRDPEGVGECTLRP